MTDAKLDKLRAKLLAAILAHVPFDGWSDRALRVGAEDIGADLATLRRAFPRGVAGVLAFWAAESDRAMLAALGEHDLDAMRVSERIATAVRERLEVNVRHREALRLALGRAALPRHAPDALAALWRSVDAMWHAAGDTATDFNFYTKRGLLAGVYSSTLLYWLNDKSDDQAESWAFLERRIADVMRVPKTLARLRACLPDPERLVRRAARGRPARG